MRASPGWVVGSARQFDRFRVVRGYLFYDRTSSKVRESPHLPFRVFGEADNANVLPLYATCRQDDELRKTGRAINEVELKICKLNNIIS
jgi:hypothetical protein